MNKPADSDDRAGYTALLASSRRSATAAEAWQMMAGLMEASRIIPTTLRAADGSLPLTILGGFLGAGKTTLLNRLLLEPAGRRLAVLVNDFGRINIDAALVRARTDDMISLANGCVCCTVSTELTRTLIELAQRDTPPDAIVLEASGLADPRGIAQIALANPALRLDGVLTLVDAVSYADSTSDDVAATIAHQLDVADLVILTKTDEATARQQHAARTRLAERYPTTPVVTAIHGDVPPNVVLGVQTTQDPRAAPPAPWDHAARFEALALQATAPLHGTRAKSFLNKLPPQLLRAKGILHLADDPSRRYVYQRVGRRAFLAAEAEWDVATPGTSLVLIGPKGTMDAAMLQRAFAELAV